MFAEQDGGDLSPSSEMKQDSPDSDELLTRNAMLLLYGVIFLFGAIGNVWVLLYIGRTVRKITVTKIFVFNLSIADLLLMLCLPVIMVRMYIGEWMLGFLMCRLYITFDGLNKFASVGFLVLLSVDRYMAVCHPMKSRRFRTAKAATVLAGLTWCIVAMITLPVFFITELVEEEIEWDNKTRLQCAFLQYADENTTLPEPRQVFTYYSFTLSYLLPLLTICALYIQVILRLRRQQTKFIEDRTSSKVGDYRTFFHGNINGRRLKRRTRRTTVMVLTIVTAYVLCWLPYWILQLGLELFGDSLIEFGDSFRLFSFVAYGLQISNSALNPLLYAMGTENNRRAIFSFCRNGFRR